MIAVRIWFKFLIMALFLTLVSAVTKGQDEVFKQIQHRFEKYSRSSVQEKVYLHTDKNFYLAGEIVWFKFYYADAASHQSLNCSKVGYVEILNRTNKPVLQAKIALNEKGGSGSFYLPLTLSSDNYIIRAYTSWMRNSGPSVFFEKMVAVVNTIKPVEGREKEDSLRVYASFFPEGGNLVNDIEAKMAFHITSQNEKGINAQGIVTNERGDTITKFSAQRFGIGHFNFKPVSGHAYKATIQLPNGQSFTSSLPTVYENGYVMNVTDSKDGRLKVKVQARGKEMGKRGESVFLVAHSHRQLKLAEAGYINYDNDLIFFIDKAKLSAGVSHLTLFNTDQQPVCERLVFKRPANSVPIIISSDKNSYETREKVNLSISAAAGEAEFNKSSYSVSVFQLDSLNTSDEADIASYFWLTSDLNGHVESPGFYFSNAADVDEATDNLLLTHGWRRFRWENILSNTNPVIKFLPEETGHLITARITNPADGKAVKNIHSFLSTPGSPFGFYTAKTDDKGIVQFDVRNYYGPGEIIVQAGQDTAGRYQADILTPFADEFNQRYIPPFSVDKTDEKGLTDKSISMQSQNIFLTDSIRRFNQPVLTDTLPFFGRPEYTYNLDDYKRFTTMEEVLREYVRPVNVVVKNGDLNMRIYDEQYINLYNDASEGIYGDNTLVLLDGVPVMNYNKIFSYDPLKVKKLDVVPRRYILRGSYFKGIVSFETYQGKFDGFEMTPGVVALDYEGLQLQREFYSPAYRTTIEKQKRLPDFRSTLFWTPDVLAGQDGQAPLQFYTSDIKGKFLAVLQGFNSIGEPVSNTCSFSTE